MRKQARQEAEVQAKSVEPEAGLKLTHPLFGIVKGEEADRFVAVKLVDGKVEALTPKRGGRDVGERVHFAVARAADAFKTACLGKRA